MRGDRASCEKETKDGQSGCRLEQLRVHIKLNTGRTVINRARIEMTTILAENVGPHPGAENHGHHIQAQKERVMRLLQT